jgi:hypothetical protein
MKSFHQCQENNEAGPLTFGKNQKAKSYLTLRKNEAGQIFCFWKESRMRMSLCFGHKSLLRNLIAIKFMALES